MHLLEKEPENRYQTADGLVHDLEAVRRAPAGAADASLRIGERDFPLRLLQRSRLVGRDAQVATVREAVEEALTGRCRGVLISGAAGVGKTALAAEVRPVVASRGGWFVAGKFDEYRRDLEFDAAHQALRALGRVLLAEPERDLTPLRARILAAVGANAGLLTALVPEFAALLAVPPVAGDPLTAQARAAQSALAVLRAVASPQRPVVVFVDDLQWAGRAPLGFVDGVLSDEPIEGLLLVGSYRDGDGDVDAAHPLAALLSRWREQAGVRHIRAGQPAGTEPRRDGRRHAARGSGERGAPGRGDRAAHARKPLRHRGAARRAAPRRRADSRRQTAGNGTTRLFAPGCSGPRSPSCSGRASRKCRRGPGRWSRRWRAWVGERS